MKQNVFKIAVSVLLVILASCAGKSTTETAGEEKATEVAVAKNVATDGLPQVIDFNATWCGPCRMFAPTFAKMGKKYEGRITFRSVDVDENPDMAAQFGVTSIPTVVYINADGEIVDETVGLLPEEEFESRLQKLL